MKGHKFNNNNNKKFAINDRAERDNGLGSVTV